MNAAEFNKAHDILMKISGITAMFHGWKDERHEEMWQEKTGIRERTGISWLAMWASEGVKESKSLPKKDLFKYSSSDFYQGHSKLLTQMPY